MSTGATEQGELARVGLIGLAVMGQNLALNIAGHGYSLAVYNRTTEKTQRFVAERAAGLPIRPTVLLEDFVASLARPRRILLMVHAGAAVDETLALLQPLLDGGDVVLDCGNSHFHDTERRERQLSALGIRYLGTGVSGGELGALHGPSIMPGGDREAYALVEELLLSVAARVDGKACCTYLGRGGAGHFVKMVHNGIEYGDMQLIAEAWHYLREGCGLTVPETATVFGRWATGPLGSFLVETTAQVLRRVDPETGRPLVELILDRAEQKGTGRWTAQAALELGVAIPTIDAALQARTLSALKEERVEAARLFGQGLPVAPPPALEPAAREERVAQLHDALLAAKITAYAQGMALLAAASREYHYDLDLGEIARIWRGGCIIRARLLDRVRAAFSQRPELPNLLLDPQLRETLLSAQPAWRTVVGHAQQLGLPMLAFGAALGYFDSYRRERLPANLIQAQRDCFGAHTYQRVDRDGTFHTDWEK